MLHLISYHKKLFFCKNTPKYKWQNVIFFFSVTRNSRDPATAWHQKEKRNLLRSCLYRAQVRGNESISLICKTSHRVTFLLHKIYKQIFCLLCWRISDIISFQMKHQWFHVANASIGRRVSVSLLYFFFLALLPWSHAQCLTWPIQVLETFSSSFSLVASMWCPERSQCLCQCAAISASNRTFYLMLGSG